MKFKFLKITFSALIIALSGVANAGLITLDPDSLTTPGGSVTYTGLITPTTTFSDAIFTLNIAGDFDNNDSSESVLISVEGFSLGRIFDNITGNDLFDFSNDDYIGSHNNMVNMTGVAVIAQTDWMTIIADGMVSITFDFSSGVDCCTSPYAFTSGNITFDSVSVPEPSTLAIFALGMIGLASRRFKKQS